jgi:hypothetical protein
MKILQQQPPTVAVRIAELDTLFAVKRVFLAA